MNTMMKKLLTATIIIAATATAHTIAQPLAVSASGQKKVTLSDKVGKNQFTWVSDAPLEKINGTAEGINGTLTIDPKNVAGIRGTISAQVATMKTGNSTRDGHLRSDQWLDAAKYPTISFTVASVKDVNISGATATGVAVGNFTMHGITKSVAVPFTLKYIEESAKTRERAPGDLVMLTAQFTISLKDFNIAGSRGTIGSKVGETIVVKAQLFGATGL